jgi:hypothetical protein
VATLTYAKGAAETVNGELLLRLVDELEAHRLPSLTKKAVARSRMCRSCRRISFSRRSRFSFAAISGDADPPGASPAWSRLRPIQRTSVESPTPRSSAIPLGSAARPNKASPAVDAAADPARSYNCHRLQRMPEPDNGEFVN